MLDLIKEYAYAFYLGFVLAIEGHTITDLSYWYITVPTIVLVNIAIRNSKGSTC